MSSTQIFAFNSYPSMTRPSTTRPILGSSRVNSFNSFQYWPQRQEIERWGQWGRPRVDSLSTNSDSDDSPSVLTPIGSPLKYSPLVWPQSVHKFNSKPNQSSTETLFNDCNNHLKYEFDANGRDVTDLPPNTFNNSVKPLFPKTTVQRPTSGPTYQLFNGFSYAKIKTAVGDRDMSGIRAKVKRRIKTQTFCSFCKNNNETPDVYNSHVVKDPYGKTTCPVLRNYDCPKCRSGGGDDGHTMRYCPLNKPGFNDYIPSVIKQLKNSRSADGKKRVTAPISFRPTCAKEAEHMFKIQTTMA